MITDKRVIFDNGSGGVSILIPSPRWQGTIDELAAKDVPTGRPYLIVDVDNIPTDRAERQFWEADFTNSDGVGA